MSVEETNAPSGVDKDGLDRKTLFIRSVPFDATSEELSEYFSQFAPVKHAVIVTDANKESRGFGFVSFAMEEDTVQALADSKKTKFKGRLLRVDIAKRRDRKDDRSRKQDGEEEEEEGAKDLKDDKKSSTIEKRRARLIIRNLPWSCKNPEKLKKIFSKYGAVFDAYIPRKKGGQMSGFAFVVMKKLAAAQKAIKESVGLKIDGREVAVDFALEKTKWEEQKEEEEEAQEDEAEEKEGDDEEAEEKEEVEADGDGVNSDDDEADDDEADDEFSKLNDHSAELEPEIKESRPKANKQEAYSVFVRNIPYDADKESLKDHFEEKFGPVKYALPVIDKATGLAKGTAFVTFLSQTAFEACLDNAPTQASGSMLISDDVSPAYVYHGRVMFITSTVDRKSAEYLTNKNTELRKELIGGGKISKGQDKRNLYLLNEGRITEQSKLAQFVSKKDMEIRDKSYQLRVQQLNKNPSLHLSMTRLAIRNIPRAMNAKALKALGRKAVVQFATEVKEEKRHALTKEEISRSTAYKHFIEGTTSEDPNTKTAGTATGGDKKKTKHTGVVRQSKIVMEVKGSGEQGRSRGYGFIEYRDHKSALMGLRWLNAHEVTQAEIIEGLTDEEKKLAELEGINKKRLIVEFAVENAQVVKRRMERVKMSKTKRHSEYKRKRSGEDGEEGGDERSSKKFKKGNHKKGNMNKGGSATATATTKPKSGFSDDIKHIIGKKRKQRKGK
ncbi:RNA recognition motif-containing protein [Scheffersomyces spartinae]|uniref:RNA recognition motif-containing protein n=1 Tax=Scheffersomyces spartinae TaxID=45513 RepID=A0A9P8AHS8_9ASCO|nr:RNA recognition motif-containing protein [Scheffersomyces spartinae]KAG7193092.1 RNA recognition motif-containing protein [Scheffersomyces spartinae]